MKFFKIILFVLLGIHDQSFLDCKQKSSKNSEHSVNDPYWDNQKKYMVKLADFCGDLPPELEMAVTMICHKSQFANVGVLKTSNFIFYGPPGTGKTYIASIFAQKIGAEFMYVQGNELLDQWQGAGVRKPAELFEKARARRDLVHKPVVMFFDEIDAVVGSRDSGWINDGKLQLIGTLLTEIGAEINNNIIVVAATNRIDAVDTAFLRSGRFDYHIPFKIPTTKERQKFLEFLINSYKHIFSDAIDWYLIACKTEGFSPADLKKLIDTLKINYITYKIQNSIIDDSCKISYENICSILPGSNSKQIISKPMNAQQKSFFAAWYVYLKSFIA
ncbi:ATP-binding protein [Candidatus Babeliales bacterium]|nr:ATP-binding protein [Candidatus Babeliales bacterium]